MTTTRHHDHDEITQPSLFPQASSVPERFRLDEATRRRGLRHVARLRAQLEARYPARPPGRSSSRTHPHAA